MLEKILALPINYFRIALCLLALLVPAWTAAPSVAGMFGVSIPANYGQWFTSIYQLYVKNQELVANARRLYTTYLSVTQTLDALEGMGSARDAFTDRWERNVRVLLQANIYWQLDEQIMDGSFDVRALLRQLFGIDFQDDRVSIRPELINLATIAIAADEDKWSQYLIGQGEPVFPTWFAPDDLLRAMADQFLTEQARNAYTSLGRDFQREASRRVYEQILQNPMLYLACGDHDPCWSPFADFSGGAAVARSWEEMLEMMYDRSHELHDPLPIDGELETNELTLASYDQYLHRRVCSAVWLALGREIKDKVHKVAHSFSRKRYEISAAIADAQYLARFLQDVLQPLDSWEPGGGTSLAAVFATSFLLDADGESKALAKSKSWIDGMINKKLAVVLERAEEVGEQIDEYIVIFERILGDIEAAQSRGRPPGHYRRWVLDPETRAWSLYYSTRPPYGLINNPPAAQGLSRKLHQALGGTP